MAKKRPLKKGEGGANQPEAKKRARFPTPDEMDMLDSILVAGAFPTPEVAEWRKMRQLANRMKYEERTGDPHPAWETAIVGDPKAPNPDGVEVDPMTHAEFLAMIQPPDGETWAAFGKTWDIGPDTNDDGVYEPVIRHQSIDSQWSSMIGQQAETLAVD